MPETVRASAKKFRHPPFTCFWSVPTAHYRKRVAPFPPLTFLPGNAAERLRSVHLHARRREPRSFDLFLCLPVNWARQCPRGAQSP